MRPLASRRPALPAVAHAVWHPPSPPSVAAKAKPQLKGNIEGDLDDVRYEREALDDSYDFM